jgi:hypothetical protein
MASQLEAPTELKRSLKCTGNNDFAQIMAADPCCLQRHKSQPTLSASLKFLPTWDYIGHYLILMDTFVSSNSLTDSGCEELGGAK